MKKLEIQNCVLGSVFTNCYFLMNKETKEMIIVDPADNPQQIEQTVLRMGGKPVAILLTHGHFDHILAANEVREKYRAEIYACKEEEAMLMNPQLSLTSHADADYVVRADVLLSDLETFEAAGFQIQMIHTPGHTKGSCCYYIKDEGVLMSGDMLFYESVGRSDLPTGSTAQIIQSLHKLLEALPEETEVFPGHDCQTTIGHEKRYNPFV